MPGDAEVIVAFVVHWNQPIACAETVRSLLAQGLPLEVLIIDNNSTPEAYDKLRGGVGLEVEIMRLPANKGWGPALNVALQDWLKQGRSRLCLISAHDAQPDVDCVCLLVDAMKRDDRVGIACPQYEEPLVPELSACHGVRLRHAAPQNRGTAELVDVPHGTLMLLRRECLREIGVFDERYFAYGDEHELGARARRHGWKVIMVWGAIVKNPATSTPSAWRTYLFARNSLLLVRAYFGRAAACLRALIIMGNALRSLMATREQGRGRWQAVRDYFNGRYGPPVIR
jgi:N-acetylglucosaminyl-diphospho-decaprenol L-rhamnosyltransferase